VFEGNRNSPAQELHRAPFLGGPPKNYPPYGNGSWDPAGDEKLRQKFDEDVRPSGDHCEHSTAHGEEFRTLLLQSQPTAEVKTGKDRATPAVHIGIEESRGEPFQGNASDRPIVWVHNTKSGGKEKEVTPGAAEEIEKIRPRWDTWPLTEKLHKKEGKTA